MEIPSFNKKLQITISWINCGGLRSVSVQENLPRNHSAENLIWILKFKGEYYPDNVWKYISLAFRLSELWVAELSVYYFNTINSWLKSGSKKAQVKILTINFNIRIFSFRQFPLIFCIWKDLIKEFKKLDQFRATSMLQAKQQ